MKMLLDVSFPIIKHLLALILCSILTITHVAGSAFTPPNGPAQQLYSMIYTVVDDSPCVLLQNSSAGIGCDGTNSDGVIGPLYPITTTQDLDDFVKLDKQQVIVLLDAEMMTSDAMQILNKSSQAMGVLVPFTTEKPKNGFSPAAQYPNKAFGLYPHSTHQWNPIGNGIASESFRFPIVYVQHAEQATNLTQQALKNKQNNFKGVLHAAQLVYKMSAKQSGNSIQCLYDGLCQPLGGQSVWSTLFPLGTSEQEANTKIVLSSVAMDSNAFFHDNAQGALSDTAAVVAQLAAATALKQQVTDPATLQHRIVFAFFTGESWGFLGSKRFLQEITAFQCTKYFKNNQNRCAQPYKYSMQFTKLNLDNVAQWVELSQIGAADTTNNGGPPNPAPPVLYMHHDANQAHTEAATSLQSALFQTIAEEAAAAAATAAAAAAGGGGGGVGGYTVQNSSISEIPPSSLMSFYRQVQKNKVSSPLMNAGTVVLTEYDDRFVNKYYHSRFDDNANINYTKICHAATLLANTLFNLAKKNSSSTTKITVSCDLVSQLADCLTKDPSTCSQLLLLLPPNDHGVKFSGGPNRYTSVFDWLNHITDTSYFVYNYLGGLTTYGGGGGGGGDNSECYVQEDCNNAGDAPDMSCVNNRCVQTSTYYHDAYSPAFAFNYDAGHWDVVSDLVELEPTFTESNWNDRYMGARAFLQDSATSDVLVLLLGLFLTVVVGALVIVSQTVYKFKKQ